MTSKENITRTNETLQWEAEVQRRVNDFEVMFHLLFLPINLSQFNLSTCIIILLLELYMRQFRGNTVLPNFYALDDWLMALLHSWCNIFAICGSIGWSIWQISPPNFLPYLRNNVNKTDFVNQLRISWYSSSWDISFEIDFFHFWWNVNLLSRILWIRSCYKHTRGKGS